MGCISREGGVRVGAGGRRGRTVRARGQGAPLVARAAALAAGVDLDPSHFSLAHPRPDAPPPTHTQSRKAKPGAPPTPHAAVGANNHHHGLGRDSMASTWAGSQDGSLAGGGGQRPGSRSDTTLGGGAGWDGGRGLARQSSVARQPLASGEWVSRKRDWGGGRAGSGVHQTGWFGRGGRAPTLDDSASGGPPLPPHIILPNERGYRECLWREGGEERRETKETKKRGGPRAFHPAPPSISTPCPSHPFALAPLVYWFLLTLLAALWTGIIDPYVVAFSASPGLYPYTDAQAWISYAITAVFCADVAVRFRLAYVDEATGDLVTRGPAIARHYARGMLAVDLLAAIPFDWIVLAFVSPTGQDSPAARYLTLLGLLRLLRLYRVRLALVAAEANLAISLLGSTIVRNLAFVFYLAHWAACGFYFCARMAGFSPATWVGRGAGGLVGASTSDRYVSFGLMGMEGGHMSGYPQPGRQARRRRWTTGAGFCRNKKTHPPTPIFTQLASLYWAVTVFTTTGFGDLVAVSRAETVWTILYMLSALVLGTYVSFVGARKREGRGESARGAGRLRMDALSLSLPLFSPPPLLPLYSLSSLKQIVGTTTLLLIKGDEAKGRYRDQASALKAYSHLNGLPPPLELAMYEHLRLAHANADIADEVVLGSLPATLRRRALRHLYAAPLKTCYLFSGGRQRFLDALLSASEVELLMAGVDVISDGDHVPDLMVCVSGTLELTLPGLAEGGEDLPLMGAGAGARSVAAASGPDPNRSVRLGVRRHLGAGDPVGEISFFTDVPHCGTARTASVARLLVIPRVAWDRISADFPLGTRTVLDNLRSRAQEMVDGEFRGAAGRALLAAAPPGIAHAQASAEAGRGVGGGRGGGAGAGRGAAAAAATAAASGGTSMSALQERVLSDLLRVQALAATVLAKSDERRTQAFLGAASRGDLTTVRVMLQQRFEVDSVDYDGRCALSLAAAKVWRERGRVGAHPRCAHPLQKPLSLHSLLFPLSPPVHRTTSTSWSCSWPPRPTPTWWTT